MKRIKKLLYTFKTTRRKLFFILIPVVILFGPFVVVVLTNADWILATFRGTSEAPIAYWKYDEGLGSTAHDSSGNNRSGTITGATWSNDEMCISGKCLSFDGTNDRVETTDTSALDIGTDDFSISAWVNRESFSTNDVVLAKKTDGSSSNAGYMISIETNGDITFLFSDGTDQYSVQSTSAHRITTPGWNHITAVADRDNATNTAIYVNGIKIATTTSGTLGDVGNISNSQGLNIGARSDAGHPFRGKIDEPKVFNYALSTDQIKSDYNTGATVVGKKDNSPLSNGLVAYWKMDEISGTRYDSSGYGNDLSDPSSTGYYTGKFGNSALLTSNSDYFNDTTFTGISNTKRWAVAQWFSTTDTQAYIFDSRTTGPGNGAFAYIDGANTIVVGVDSSNTDVKNYTYTATITDGNWHHFLLTRDGDNSISLYIDGQLITPAIKTIDTNISSLSETWSTYTLGLRFAGAIYYFDGILDEARVYSRSFSKNDVTRLYSFTPGPIGYWKLDENNGTNAFDSSGNGYTGTLTGNTSWSSGKFGSAVSFDGVSDYIAVGDNLDIDNMGTITVSAWFYPTSNSQDMVIVGKNNSPTDQNEIGYGIRSWSNANGGNTCFYVSDGSGNGSDQYETCTPDHTTDTINRWYHITAVFDNTGFEGSTIYLNGVKAEEPAYEYCRNCGGTTPDFSQIGSPANGNGFCIGSNSAGSGACGTSNEFSGLIDNVKVYNYVRTPSQVIEEMNGGHPLVGSPNASALGHWRMDLGRGSTVSNSGNGGSTLNGTLSNASWSNLGKERKALDFNGTTSYVSIPNSNSIDLDIGLSAEFTFTAWINPDNAGEGNGGRIFSKGTNTWLRVDTLSGGRLDIQASLDLTTADATVNLSSAVPTGSWSHVAMKYQNDSDDEIDIYVNGKLIGSSTNGSGSPAVTDTANLIIGNDTTSATQTFDGKIDEFKLYSASLSEAEIHKDYNAGKTIVLGSTSTDASGNPSNSADRAYCPPGDTTTTCGPVGYWNFENFSTLDSSGNGLGGTVGCDSNARMDRSIIGKGMKFNGNNQCVSVSDNSLLRPGTGSMTISLWANPANANQGSTLVSKFNIAQTHGYIVGLSNSTITGPGQNLVVTFSQNGSTLRSATTTADIADGKWHHYVAVRDATNSTIYIYVDGIRQTTNNYTAGSWPNITNTDIFYISGVTPQSFNGIIDEVKVYNYARTPAQVAWDYNGGKPIAHYRFDECSGSTAYDSSGNNLHGTLAPGGSGTTTVGDCTTNATSMRYIGRIGKFNSGLDFDSTDDRVELGSPSHLDDLGPMTVSAWIYPNTFGESSNGRIMAKGESGGSAGFWTFHFDGSNALRFEKDSSSGSELLQQTVNNSIQTGKWQHVAVTWNGGTTDSDVKIYVDGLETLYNGSANSDAGGSLVSDASLNAYIGNRGDNDRTFDGIIDDVQIFNYPLSVQQIREVMNQGAVRY